MKVIINATPLIALASLNRLNLLANLFDEVIVPQAVYDEVVVQGIGKHGSATLASVTWLQIVTPRAVPTIEPMLLGLDLGELQVLLLAAVLADLLPKQEALDALSQLLVQGIRISPRWQAWFREEIGKL